MSAATSGPTDDGPMSAVLKKGASSIRDKLKHVSPSLIRSFDPMADPQRTRSPPRGFQSEEDKLLDGMRAAMCTQMQTFYKARAWNDLCGGRILSKSYNFGAATTGAEDIVPMCGLESALSCAQGMGTAAQGSGGTADSSEAIMDCDLVSWRAACLDGPTSFNANKKDPGYNQRAFGRVPIDCYCACYDQCTMGQSSVLGSQAQRNAGAQCTLGQLRSGKCREHGGVVYSAAGSSTQRR